jgi:hypothetical protein
VNDAGGKDTSVARTSAYDTGESPYLSVVVSGRNDDYGGMFLGRLDASVSAAVRLAHRHHLRLELIVVDWNPPREKPGLAEAISWPQIDHGGVSVRVITVPKGLHDGFENPGGHPMLEYPAQNAGIVRSKGAFVLATNPDVVISEELMAFLSREQLREDKLYRTDRLDVLPQGLPDVSDIDMLLRHCATHVSVLNDKTGSYRGQEITFSSGGGIRRRESLTRMIVRRSLATQNRLRMTQRANEAHFNASGDFTLMHRSSWEKLRGYPEVGGPQHHIDSYMVIAGLNSGLKQVILPEPMRIYHIDHLRGKEGKPMNSMHPRLLPLFDTMLKTRSVPIFNEESWGLRDERLEEIEIH